eukprot:TRINITY_DN411_c0_g2_i1.p1 TRINITY_DN411_c0_g2~~TRINITY_DN411_c0_g2_i1.p1  ORF type:complete len:664 (+),score=92.32 TRINITY_DN411_c0_g2_i1:343-2334(+)
MLKMINDTTLLGIIYSNDMDSSEVIRSRVSGTTTPFIAPSSANATLSTPFQRNVLNFRPTFTAELLSMVQYVVQYLAKDNFCLYYDQEYWFIPQLLNNVLFQQSINFISCASSLTNNNSNITAQFTATNPNVVIIWSKNVTRIEQFLSFITPLSNNSVSFLLNYNPSLLENPSFLNFLQQTFSSSPNDFSTTILYPSSFDINNTLIQQFNSDSTLFSTTPIDPSLFPLALEGYYVGLYITNILERIDTSIPLSRSSFLDSAYINSVLRISGLYSGPISDDCDAVGYSCCNKLTHRTALATFNPFNTSLTIDASSVLTWSGSCNAKATSLLPVRFGTIVDPTSQPSKDIANGVLTAFSRLNDDPSRIGQRPLQLVIRNATLANSTDAFRQTRALIETDKVVSLLSYPYSGDNVYYYLNNNSFPLIDPVGGELRNRVPFIKNMVNIRTSNKDRIVGAFHYIINQTKDASKVINIGMYYVAGLSGNDTREAFVNQTQILEQFPPGIIPRFNVLFILSDTDYKQNQAYFNKTLSNVRGTQIDYIFFSSRAVANESVGSIRTVLSLTGMDKPDPNTGIIPINVILISDAAGNQKAISLLLAEQTGIVPIGLQAYPLFGANTINSFTSNITLLKSYTQAATTYGPSATEVGTSGFVAGMFVGQVMKNIY